LPHPRAALNPHRGVRTRSKIKQGLTLVADAILGARRDRPWPQEDRMQATRCRPARRVDLGLPARAYAQLRALATPSRIQAFVDAIPINHEPDGETVHSVSAVLDHRRAHCIEGAFVAACALWIHGEPPLLMHLDTAGSDPPHVVALFRRGGHWGALSKCNHAQLRFRDPIYRSLRELALSFFHEYCDRQGRKTLRSYSSAFDLRRLAPGLWVTRDDACWEVHDRLAASPHHRLVSAAQVRSLRPQTVFERRATSAVQYPRR
jgi:hypothetical protein